MGGDGVPGGRDQVGGEVGDLGEAELDKQTSWREKMNRMGLSWV